MTWCYGEEVNHHGEGYWGLVISFSEVIEIEITGKQTGTPLGEVFLIEVEGIQGAGSQIFFGGGWIPKITYHGDDFPLAPPLRAVSPPPIK